MEQKQFEQRQSQLEGTAADRPSTYVGTKEAPNRISSSVFTYDETEETGSSIASSGSGEEEEEREEWRSKWGYFFAIIAYTVAYGNLWRFPSICYQSGGGAFFIPYFIFYVVLGLPLLLLESSIGQFSSRCIIGAWDVCPLFKGMSWTCLSIAWGFLWYNSMTLSWTLYYFFACFGDEIPWNNCGHSWNTIYCVDENTNKTAILGYNNTRTPSEEFWDYEVLDLGTGIENIGTLRWSLLGCNTLTWIVVFLCISRGVNFLGKVAYVTSTFPVLTLTILLFRGLFLPGSTTGIVALFTPDWSKLASFTVWTDAASHVFYSLGVGVAGFPALASFNKFKSRNFRLVLYLPCIDCFASVFSSLVIFPFLGYMSQTSGVPISRLLRSGPGLFFVVFPTALAKMPFAYMWSRVFFLMLFCIGLDCQFIFFYSLVSSIIEILPIHWRKKSFWLRMAFCGAQCLLGIPSSYQGGIYLLTLFDHYSTVYCLMLVSVMQCLIISWVYGADRFVKDIELMGGYEPSFLWKYMWKYVTPGVTMVMYIHGLYSLTSPMFGDYHYPPWAESMGKLLGIFNLLLIPSYALYAISKETSGSPYQRVLKLMQPDVKFAPYVYEDRKSYIATFTDFDLLRYTAAKKGVPWRTFQQESNLTDEEIKSNETKTKNETENEIEFEAESKTKSTIESKTESSVLESLESKATTLENANGLVQ